MQRYPRTPPRSAEPRRPAIEIPYYLNTLNERGERALPSAPESVFFHVGAGSNIVYVDPVNDLVIVTRWISSNRALDAMVKVLTTK